MMVSYCDQAPGDVDGKQEDGQTDESAGLPSSAPLGVMFGADEAQVRADRRQRSEDRETQQIAYQITIVVRMGLLVDPLRERLWLPVDGELVLAYFARVRVGRAQPLFQARAVYHLHAT